MRIRSASSRYTRAMLSTPKAPSAPSQSSSITRNSVLKMWASVCEQAKDFGISRGWTRLEVTTPPLPQFDKTLAFYERQGFANTGGRKLKLTR